MDEYIPSELRAKSFSVDSLDLSDEAMERRRAAFEALPYQVQMALMANCMRRVPSLIKSITKKL